MAEYRAALAIDPDYAEAHYNLGNALLIRGRVPAAVAEYRRALAIRPDFAKARHNLEIVLSHWEEHRAKDTPPRGNAE